MWKRVASVPLFIGAAAATAPGCAAAPDEVVEVSVDRLDAPTVIPGVHAPLPIDPTVEIQDAQWLLDAYRVFFDREHDVAGYRANLHALEGGLSRVALTEVFREAAELRASPLLATRDGFVRRLYHQLLRREPSAEEVSYHVANLRQADGSGQGLSWSELMSAFYAAPEYKGVTCQTGAYSLGARVKPGALLLADLFSARARLQTIAESEPVDLVVPSAQALWDQKLPVLEDPHANRYLAFTRAYAGNGAFDIVLLTSTDAVHFTEDAPLFERSGAQTFYDPHVSIDASVCPPRYVMLMECLGSEGASLCASESTTPGRAETWSTPRLLVDGCAGRTDGICGSPAAQSASTGTGLIDGHDRYIGWTQVYDGVGPGDPQVHTYSQVAKVDRFDRYFGNVMRGTSPIATMMSAEPLPYCTSAWDCNNRDAQDWKREGDFFYAIYNGANHYRCEGSWGVGIARSATPFGTEYADRLPLARGIAAERHDICGISYPVLNVIDGELFVYYAYYPSSGGNRTMRARLVATP